MIIVSDSPDGATGTVAVLTITTSFAIFALGLHAASIASNMHVPDKI